MPRPMTPAEQQRFQGYFSNLDVNQAVVTGNASLGVQLHRLDGRFFRPLDLARKFAGKF